MNVIRTVWHSAAFRVSAIVAGIVLVLAGLFTVWPSSLGGRALWTTVAGPSMEPTWHTGDLVLMYNTGTWGIGDAVVYEERSDTGVAYVIHRIIDGNAKDGWTIQGDNKPMPDEGLIAQERIVGEELLTIPGVGTALLSANAAKLPLLFGGLLAAGSLLYLAVTLLRGKDDEDDSIAPSDATA